MTETDNGALVLTEGEAAKMLRLSRRTLQRLRLDGGGPPFIVLTPNGSRIGYSVAELRSWIAARTVATTSAAAVRLLAA